MTERPSDSAATLQANGFSPQVPAATQRLHRSLGDLTGAFGARECHIPQNPALDYSPVLTAQAPCPHAPTPPPIMPQPLPPTMQNSLSRAGSIWRLVPLAHGGRVMVASCAASRVGFKYFTPQLVADSPGGCSPAPLSSKRFCMGRSHSINLGGYLAVIHAPSGPARSPRVSRYTAMPSAAGWHRRRGCGSKARTPAQQHGSLNPLGCLAVPHAPIPESSTEPRTGRSSGSQKARSQNAASWRPAPLA